jgi:hypothetical protein
VPGLTLFLVGVFGFVASRHPLPPGTRRRNIHAHINVLTTKDTKTDADTSPKKTNNSFYLVGFLEIFVTFVVIGCH